MKDARKLVLRKDMTYAALNKDGKELWSGTYDLDPTASPKAWDHRSHDSQKKGGDALSTSVGTPFYFSIRRRST
jgi:hypothetical protein